jgi:hypothetical protein
MSRVFTDIQSWTELACRAPRRHPPLPRAAFLVAPDALAWNPDSASDNLYMQGADAIDSERAQAQHRALHRALAQDLPVVCFPGQAGQPDGVFPNNVFATAQTAQGPRLLVGNMRHPQRRLEAQRADIRRWFTELLGYALHDLGQRAGLSELTGTLLIDRSRGLGIAGLGPRCDLAGAKTMSEGFGLHGCLAAPMADAEYHANVVLALPGSRAAVIATAGWAQPTALCEALARLYGAQAVIELDCAERRAFAGNCIALRDDRLWMSERAADALRSSTLARLEANRFRVGSVALDEIEKAGGSLRCCVAEIF